MGAAYDLLKAEFGGEFDEKETTVVTGAATVVAAALNPDRLGLTFVNFGAFDEFLTLSGTPPASSGIRLAANGGSVSMTLRDDLGLVPRQWFVTSPGGASSIYVLETVRAVATG